MGKSKKYDQYFSKVESERGGMNKITLNIGGKYSLGYLL